MRIRLRLEGRWTCVALAALLASCGPSPHKQATEAVASLRSWTATARLTGEVWLAGKAPSPYARITLEKAARKLDEEIAAAGSLPAAAGIGPALRHLPATSRPAAALADAVVRGDRAAARSELARLVEADRALAALEKRLSGTER